MGRKGKDGDLTMVMRLNGVDNMDNDEISRYNTSIIKTFDS